MESAIRRPGILKGVLRKAHELGSGPIARASAVSLVIRVAGLALSFAQAVLTARLLGAGGYGTVAVAMSIVSILATICLFGFGPLAVREIPARTAADDAAGTAAFLRYAALVVLAFSAAATIALVVVVAATDWVPPVYRTALGVGALLVAPLAFLGLFRGAAQGFGRIVLAQAPGDLVRPAILVLIMGAAALLGLRFGPTDYMWSAAGAALLAAIAAGAWLWGKDLRRLPSPTPRRETRRNFAAALPFLGLGLTGILQGEINTLLLGWFAGPHETGVFQPIARLAPLMMLPVQAAGMRYAPRIAEFWQRGEVDRIRSVTATFTWTTCLLTLVIALAIAAAGPWLMGIFGSEFRQSAPLLWYIAAAQAFNAACGPVGMLLTMSGRSGGALAGQVFGLAVNAAVGAALIPAHGAWGAVVAMTVGIVAWNVTMLMVTRARYGFDPSLAGALLRVGGAR